MIHKKLIVRNYVALFAAGLLIGGGLGASLHKETIVVRQGVADTPAAMTSVNLMIDYGTGTIRTWNTVSWHEAMSVLNLMEMVTGAEVIPLLTKEDKGGLATISSINGIQNDAKTNMRWQYWINNTYEPRIASKYFLKPGDIVLWKYAAEQTK
jgi:hypothetical protein